ncbi:WYL domain-containing protein [Paenibacillus rhizovicinus]|uniref:WYL domain-containing protein n=1 Tax=Paenibacillus rhizovicinus TaxID=2704463 RepID=A0A6C0P039_9BACL|nr:WYL domain-containing protein [Paenibacillus rhizovicinus]QHW31845.1 WYL domain-containing protein [Paenibacillus rhizovicinus]
MNLFEKIFNYQIISRLDESGSFALTSQERTWLKTMLAHEASADAFTEETLHKLRGLLQDEASTDILDIIMEKAKSQERQVYHPLLRVIRRIIMQNGGIRLSFKVKHGGVKANQTGFPVKLEYNMFKREWYLLWCSTRSRSLMSTKLKNIVTIEAMELPDGKADSMKARVALLLDQRTEHAVIQVMPTYNAELSRILYAFSCFDKSVDYDEEAALYRIRVSYLADESEFLLSKIRFLGLRVKVVQGEVLKRRMSETAAKALGRYGIEPQLRDAEA